MDIETIQLIYTAVFIVTFFSIGSLFMSSSGSKKTRTQQLLEIRRKAIKGAIIH